MKQGIKIVAEPMQSEIDNITMELKGKYICILKDQL